MFVINISYTAPADIVANYRQDHISWLQSAVDSGLIAAAGSKPTRDGGVLLSLTEDRNYLQEQLAEDPYSIAGVAQHTVDEAHMTLTAPGLEQLGRTVRAERT